MPIFTNIAGAKRLLTDVAVNVGGVMREFDTVHANVGGVLHEIFSAWSPQGVSVSFDGSPKSTVHEPSLSANPTGVVYSASSSSSGSSSCSCTLSATYTLTKRTAVTIDGGGGGGGGPVGSGSFTPPEGYRETVVKEPGTYTVRCSAGASASLGNVGSEGTSARPSCSCNCNLVLKFFAL